MIKDDYDPTGHKLAQSIKRIEMEQEDSSWFLYDEEITEMNDEIDDLEDLVIDDLDDVELDILWDDYHPHEADEFFEPLTGEYIPTDELD